MASSCGGVGGCTVDVDERLDAAMRIDAVLAAKHLKQNQSVCLRMYVHSDVCEGACVARIFGQTLAACVSGMASG